MKLVSRVVGAAWCAGTLWVATPPAVAAGVTSAGLISETVGAVPSCLDYKVTGACFWLKCVLFKCSVKTSIKISHFNPDLVMSSYHDVSLHPWNDWGQAVTNLTKKAAPALLGAATDSQGTRFNDDRTDTKHEYRDANAIGNPLALLSSVIGGGTIQVPTSIQIPGAGGMGNFTSSLGGAQGAWNSLPNTQQNNDAKSQANIGSLIPSLQGMLSSVGGALSSAGIGQKLPINAGNMGNLNNFAKLSKVGLGMGGSGFFCPPAVTPFWPYFDSQVDALVWRDYIPMELIYPASWIPGMRELSSNFLVSTWGNVYPRTGRVTQYHPVKTAALLSQRMADIVSRTGQPHFYIHPTQKNGGFRYFDAGDEPITELDSRHKWQRVYPNAEKSCSKFGGNDSVNPMGFGDGNTSQEQSYIFNYWRRYECCQKKGQVFLFSI